MNKQYLLRWVPMLLLAIIAVGVVDARTRKGDKLLKEGQAAELSGDWDKALGLYQQAVDESGSDAGYLIAMRRARFQASAKHVDAGQKMRSEGKLAEALAEFQKGMIADPSSAIATQEVKRTQQMMMESKAGMKPEDVALTPAERARRDDDARVASILAPPELKPVLRRIPSLKMNNQPPRVLFETVGKLAGINVVFDSQYTPPARGFNVDVTASGVEEAFDYLAVVTHTFWKPISSNTIFVTEDNVTKRRDYEDEVVKVFYVTNATSTQEFQEIATAIRTVAEIRRVYTYNAQKAMVVRDTADKVALAEKLIHDLDKPKAEVVVDVIVMEANSARTRDLAATIANGATAGLNIPIGFTPRNGITTSSSDSPTTATSSIRLSQLGKIASSDFSTTLPGGLLQAMLADNKTKVMSSPQVRASDGQKVSLKIGDRIPYATGSFTPGSGSVGVSALVSTQFNFAEVGVNVDITPQVHSAQEVTLHVEVEVSSVKQYVNLGGVSQPVIGQRKNIADIRLREGEVNILGGLSSSQDSSTVNGIPGLVDIPILGKLFFGSEHTEKDRQELMIALVPHILRTPDYTAENLRGIYAGSDQIVKLNYAPKPDDAPAPAAAAGPAVTQQAQSFTQAQAPVNAVRSSFTPSPVQVAADANFTVSLQLENVTSAFSLSSLKIKFDPALMRLNDIAPGVFFSSDGGRVTSVKDIRNDTGEATLTITRLPGSPGVSGSGAAAVLNFVAVAKGAGTLSVTELGLKNEQLQPMAGALTVVPVTVQ